SSAQIDPRILPRKGKRYRRLRIYLYDYYEFMLTGGVTGRFPRGESRAVEDIAVDVSICLWV
ncbi:TPA: hypothetical protein ACNUZ9_001688, partial [Raoultella ornithinolytica]